jgi:hypothetical protein
MLTWCPATAPDGAVAGRDELATALLVTLRTAEDALCIAAWWLLPAAAAAQSPEDGTGERVAGSVTPRTE